MKYSLSPVQGRPPEVARRDYIYGQALAAGSRLVQSFPAIDTLIGKTTDELQVPLQWLHLPASTRGMAESEWLTYNGDPNSSKVLPKGFKGVAKLSVDSFSLVEEVHDNEDVHQAIAYKLGSSMMVGVRPNAPHNLFVPDPENEDRLAVGMRVGRGALNAAIGVYSSDYNIFMNLADHLSQGGVTALADNTLRFG